MCGVVEVCVWCGEVCVWCGGSVCVVWWKCMFVWGGTVGVGTVGSDHCNTVKETYNYSL